MSHLLGVEVRDEMVLESGGKQILFLHGHRFDEFISRTRSYMAAADRFYHFLQRIDRSHYFAKLAKQRSKIVPPQHGRRSRRRPVGTRRRQGCDAVCCGHTHLAVASDGGPVRYFNSGCWTEKPCHYLTIEDGAVAVNEYHDESAEEFAPVVAPLAVA